MEGTALVRDGREFLRSAQNDTGVLNITMAWVRPHEVMDVGGVSRSAGKAGLKPAATTRRQCLFSEA